jgi:2-desacetyl-2-hydroxyethyl bacteriochlorophyllide A dehydrogenase
MKQAIMVAPSQIELRDVPVPAPGPGEVRLKIYRIGVCGSDVHVYHGRHPFTRYPVVQGHEFSGEVEAVGPGVTDLRLGVKVTALPQIVCGACRPCRRGEYHICDHLRVQGFQAPGCAQELWVTKAEKILPLPETISYDQGALVEPTAVAVHAVSRIGDLAGCRAVVLGAGPIGNLVAQVARTEGAEVLIVDLSSFRLDAAKSCGISATSNAAAEPLDQAMARTFGEAGFDVAFECVGAEATVDAAICHLQKGGALVIVGVFGMKPQVNLGLVQDRELKIYGTLMYRREDYTRAIELIASAQIATAPLISRHFPLREYAQAYQFIESQGNKALKVFIDLE